MKGYIIVEVGEPLLSYGVFTKAKAAEQKIKEHLLRHAATAKELNEDPFLFQDDLSLQEITIHS